MTRILSTHRFATIEKRAPGGAHRIVGRGEGFSNRLETLLGQPTFGAFSFLFESTYTFLFILRQVPEPFGCFICDGILITLFLIL